MVKSTSALVLAAWLIFGAVAPMAQESNTAPPGVSDTGPVVSVTPGKDEMTKPPVAGSNQQSALAVSIGRILTDPNVLSGFGDNAADVYQSWIAALPNLVPSLQGSCQGANFQCRDGDLNIDVTCGCFQQWQCDVGGADAPGVDGSCADLLTRCRCR